MPPPSRSQKSNKGNQTQQLINGQQEGAGSGKKLEEPIKKNQTMVGQEYS
jgi:hypothetical protein